MVERRDVGSWLSGPKAARADGGASAVQEYRGQRLGRPASGPGSVAGFGRRLAALAIDWAASILLSRLFFPGLAYGGPESSVAILAIFVLEVIVLTWLTAASFGQRLVGVEVVRLDGRRVGLLAVVVRTLLLALVVPAIITDADGRGLHDKAAGSLVIRFR